MSNNTSKIEVKCSTCSHSLFDNLWGEYKCKKKQRRSTESECKMGCSDWQKLGAKADEPKPEILVRSGATFTPHVSDSGVLSWTNDKGLPNPKSVNVKGEKGEQGEKGEKGADGAVGFSPVMAVEDIVGGHRVTITDKDGKKTFDVMDGKDGEGGTSIIDVLELPTENIDEDSFYRLMTGTFVYNQYPENGWVCYCVESLPEFGEPATNADLSAVTIYYNTQNEMAYGYVDATLSQFFGVSAGWYSASMLFTAAGYTYNGVITDILDCPLNDTFYLLIECVIWSYKDGKWTSHKTIGWVGDEYGGAEAFNHPANKAFGYVSHAEGRFTVAGKEGVKSYGAHAEGWETQALSDASHAEGFRTRAEGGYSHAEGHGTCAENEASHAEGYYTTASGVNSHAEGHGTCAEGGYSHAEGFRTRAEGGYSHVQGKYNIEDTENKYAHIVGNGTDPNNHSNAHTIDWDGLGWFAGGLKVGGTGQDDPNAEEILTKSQVQALIDEAIAKLNL